MKFRKAWLTLTHMCNLKCEWCYDKDNYICNNQYMNLYLAIEIINLLHEVGCKSINLIGGEPTLHPNLDRIIDYASKIGLSVTLVTNGIAISDTLYFEYLRSKGLKNIYLSCKGKDNIYYKAIGNEKGFDKFAKSLENCSKNNMDCIIDLVITSKNIDEILDWIRSIRKFSSAIIHLSICKPSISTDGITNIEYIMSPRLLVEKFENLYINNKDFAEERFVLHQTLPFCLWNQNVIEQLRKRRQIGIGCQLLHRDGIIFDVNGELMLCNGLANFPYGKFGESFVNKETMSNFYNKKNIQLIFDEMCKLPDAQCNSCHKLQQCFGGCAVQWFSYSFKQIFGRKD